MTPQKKPVQRQYSALPTKEASHSANPRPTSHQPNARNSPRKHTLWKEFFDFTRHSTLMLVALVLGILGAMASFAFTYWLSRQIFFCPPWTTSCKVQQAVHWFTNRLGFVQGFVSSIYGISIAMIAYSVYQYAETTMWPALTQQPLTLEGIDSYLAHARGSLPSFPFAAWHARKPKHAIVVWIVGLIGLLLQATSTIVGFAYTLVPVSTTYQSNHTTGGGMGFGYSQFNPPGPMPEEPSMALAIYSGWSTGQDFEMLPDLREYLIDRTNLSLIGNFSVPALYAKKSIHCYGAAVELLDVPQPPYYNLYVVATQPMGEFGGSLLTHPGQVLLRFLPNTLTTWVDSYWNLSEHRAVTKLMFATVNATIENGKQNQFGDLLNSVCMAAIGSPCTGLSGLACEVDIDLIPSHACNGPCTNSKSTALTTLDVTKAGNVSWALAVWLGAIPATMGPQIWGAQPMFSAGLMLPNSSFALPQAYSDILGAGTQSWSVANLTNFINVTSGALGTYVANAFPQGLTVVESTLEMPRMAPARTFSLLAPLGIALASVILVAVLSYFMHREAGVTGVKLGSTSEILVRSATGELKALTEGTRAGRYKPKALHQKLLWFGLAGDGHDGLDTQVSPFRHG